MAGGRGFTGHGGVTVSRGWLCQGGSPWTSRALSDAVVNGFSNQNNNFAHAFFAMQHTFLYMFLSSLHDYDIKYPQAMPYGGCKHNTANFSVSF